MAARLAWSLAAVAGALVTADVLITAAHRSLFSEAAVAVHGFPFVDCAVLGSAVMGALVVTRDRRQVIGWLLVAMGVAGALSMVAEAYAGWVLDGDGPGSRSAAGIAGWVSALVGGQLAITGMVFLFLLVPDGRFLSSRWRVPAMVSVLGESLILLGMLTIDPSTYDVTDQRAGGGAAAREPLNSVGFLLLTSGMVAALVSIVVRLRRSSGVERQQLRIVALSAASICGGILWLLLVELLVAGPQTYVTILPLYVSYLLFPVLLAIAVLRYRLYDVDVIVNRTVVLALATAFAALGYTALVVLVGGVIGRRTDVYWLSLTATALVAIAFQPLRRTVVAAANRIAFGSRAQPYEALAAFSRRLTATPSDQLVLSAVADAAGRAVSAHGATASLRASGLTRSSAYWGTDDGATVHEHVVLVEEGGTTLGSIGVSIPPGRPLRPSDARLLRAIADQAAVSFHNMAMEADLSGKVAALDRVTQDLARSRARIVEADEAARRSLAAGISQQVLPHLASVAGELGPPPGGSSGSPQRIDDMVTEVNVALRALRELTHGVFPAQLGRAGLGPALRSFVREHGLGVRLEIAPTAVERRFAPRVEAAFYFAATRAVSTGLGRGVITLRTDDDRLHCTVRGGGLGGLDLRDVRDRVEAVGGTLRLVTGALELRVPLAEQVRGAASAVDSRPRG